MREEITDKVNKQRAYSETKRDGSENYSVEMKEYKLLRKDRLGRQRRRITHYMRKLKCMEFCLYMDKGAN